MAAAQDGQAPGATLESGAPQLKQEALSGSFCEPQCEHLMNSRRGLFNLSPAPQAEQKPLAGWFSALQLGHVTGGLS